eukprot:scaffold171435_cov32-Tisochrysis_lutea.AAC.2
MIVPPPRIWRSRPTQDPTSSEPAVSALWLVRSGEEPPASVPAPLRPRPPALSAGRPTAPQLRAYHQTPDGLECREKQETARPNHSASGETAHAISTGVQTE